MDETRRNPSLLQFCNFNGNIIMTNYPKNFIEEVYSDIVYFRSKAKLTGKSTGKITDQLRMSMSATKIHARCVGITYGALVRVYLSNYKRPKGARRGFKIIEAAHNNKDFKELSSTLLTTDLTLDETYSLIKNEDTVVLATAEENKGEFSAEFLTIDNEFGEFFTDKSNSGCKWGLKEEKLLKNLVESLTGEVLAKFNTILLETKDKFMEAE